MPRLRRIDRVTRHDWGAPHFMQLVTGDDFFGDAFGNELTPEVLEEMAECWREHRDDVLKTDVASRFLDVGMKVWAERVFDGGADPASEVQRGSNELWKLQSKHTAERIRKAQESDRLLLPGPETRRSNLPN